MLLQQIMMEMLYKQVLSIGILQLTHYGLEIIVYGILLHSQHQAHLAQVVLQEHQVLQAQVAQQELQVLVVLVVTH